ncbi:MAG: cytochrome c oxidase subunit II [Gammaproteobacteria bacterium HGW-Gammaproteobacteria-15]|nr:MAG: cytochrome c oxidase subunit II [Gammaproteobacteria bacterium HGW-Gammaproteobacteria-15]
MAKNHNLAGDGLHRHNISRLKLKITKKKRYQPSLAAVCSTGLLLNLSGCSGPFSSLDPKGPAAAEVALLWWGMFGFATLILLLVAILWFYAIKRRSDDSPLIRPNAWLCWGGLALPLLSITVLLLIGIPVGQRMLPLADDNALKIEVTGHQWYWQVYYPGHAIELTDELHIPVNTPVYLQLTSADVIHSFWVPRLGVKLDMLPGRTNVLRLEASEAGIYRGQCAEYCGLGHAHMQFSVIAHEQAAFATWLKEHSADD